LRIVPENRRPQSSTGKKPVGNKPAGKKPAGKGAPTRAPKSGRGGAPQRGGRPQERRRPPEPAARTKEQAAYDGPDLPEGITGAELDRSVTAQLKGLPEKLAARGRAPRLAVVREAAGEAAYASGHYAEALADLRAAKRMNGGTAYLPIMADCHRALGQPDQALKLARSPSVASFPPALKAEMTIVEAGARRDLGQVDAALRVLEQAPLNSKSREPWVVRLRYAYADALEEAGRAEDALAWFHRTQAIDADDFTDAAARAASLEKAGS